MWRVLESLMCGWRKKKRFGLNLLGNYEEKIKCLEFRVKEKKLHNACNVEE